MIRAKRYINIFKFVKVMYRILYRILWTLFFSVHGVYTYLLDVVEMIGWPRVCRNNVSGGGRSGSRLRRRLYHAVCCHDQHQAQVHTLSRLVNIYDTFETESLAIARLQRAMHPSSIWG